MKTGSYSVLVEEVDTGAIQTGTTRESRSTRALRMFHLFSLTKSRIHNLKRKASLLNEPFSGGTVPIK